MDFIVFNSQKLIRKLKKIEKNKQILSNRTEKFKKFIQTNMTKNIKEQEIKTNETKTYFTKKY